MSPALAALTAPDVIVLAVCVLLGVRGAVRGFVWQAIRTVGLVAAFWLGTLFYGPFGDWLHVNVGFIPEAVAPVAAWVSIAVGVILVFGFLAYMGRGLVKTANLSGVDRFLGLGLGAAMGLVVCVAGFVIWGQLSGKQSLADTLEGSTSAVFMARTVEVLGPVFPEGVRERFRPSLEAIEEAEGAASQLED